MYNILIIDDKEVFRRKIKRLDFFSKNSDLCKISYEAQNGSDALEILRNNNIDITITDIRMPIMNGIDLLKIIKEENLCKCTILLSEYTDFYYAKEGIVYGAFDYIIKPINNDKITNVLTRAFDYLKTTSTSVAFWENLARDIVDMIVDRDAGYHSVIKLIFDETMKISISPDKAFIEAKHLLKFISSEVIKKKPNMIKFVPTNEICEISGTYEDASEIFSEVSRKLDLLFKEINKFESESNNALINNICGYIINNIEQEVNLQTIADEFFINKKYLSSCFKKETGVGFVEFVTTVKIERAKMLIADKNLKVYEVSAKLGFSDTEYFSKLFKQKTGQAPTEFEWRFDAYDKPDI